MATGLPWIRLDTSMPDNPKIIALAETVPGRSAAFVWLCVMAYSGKHGTGGFIPRGAIARANGRPQDVSRLVEAGLLDEVPGGYQVHDWDEYQLSDAEVQARRDRAKHAAAVRWSKDEVKKARRRNAG